MIRSSATAALLAAFTTFATVLCAHEGHDHAESTEAHPDRYVLGALTIAGAFSRATLPGAPVAGGFFSVTNDGALDDRLTAAASAVAGRVEIHEMAMVGDVMRMRELPEGLVIPAGGTVALEPGGYHVMLMELKAPLVEGETVELVLTFEAAGEIAIPLEIRAPNARGAGHGQHGAPSMQGHDGMDGAGHHVQVE